MANQVIGVRERTVATAAKPAAGVPRRLRVLLRNRTATVGGILLAAIGLVLLLFPLVSRGEPALMNLSNALKGPGEAGLLGADQLGRDVLTRIMHGGRVSLTIGLVATVSAAIVGVLLGLATGYLGGRLDLALMAICDIILAFPTILFALFLVTTLGPGLRNLILALIIREIPSYIRLVRSSVLSLRELDYVTAARAAGARAPRVLGRHLLPNLAGPVIVHSTFLVARSIITAAGLGFLGLGVSPPTPEWGVMLAESRPYLEMAPYLVIAPGTAIVLTVLALNLFGDGLRDALDPQMRP